MRILLSADPELPVPPARYGGIERIVDALVSAFRAAGHEVGLVAHPDSRSSAHRLFAWPGRRSRSRLDTLRNILALRRAVHAFRPDVLHSFSRVAYLLPLLRSPLPKVMSYQRHTGGRSVTLAARLGGPHLHFTGCSDFISAQGRRAGGTWTTIPNFVDPARYTFVPHVAPDAPLVFLSRVESIKGPDLAIAIARAAGRRLVLAGNHAVDGPERHFWDTRIAPELGRDGVEWIGEVDDAQKNTILGRAAALLLPIQWDEPFGIVYAEALACGTPILTCPRGAAPKIVESGRTGFFLSSVTDGVDFVRRIPELDRAACRRDAETRFSVDVCAQRYLALYRSLLTPNCHP